MPIGVTMSGSAAKSSSFNRGSVTVGISTPGGSAGDAASADSAKQSSAEEVTCEPSAGSGKTQRRGRTTPRPIMACRGSFFSHQPASDNPRVIGAVKRRGLAGGYAEAAVGVMAAGDEGHQLVGVVGLGRKPREQPHDAVARFEIRGAVLVAAEAAVLRAGPRESF